LESIACHAQDSGDIRFLTEKARQALANQICRQYADSDNLLRVLTIDPSLEQKILDSKAKTSSGIVSILDPPTHTMWIKAVGKAVRSVRDNGYYPVILCSEQARFLVKDSTSRELPELVVLSVPEITDVFTVESIGVISINEAEE
jgi:flagellar biosynthesis protein FlhA